MKKKICIGIGVLSVILVLGGIFFLMKREERVTSDAIRFQEEYESLNQTIREKDGQEIRSIQIPKNNPIIYQEASKIVQRIHQKESFIVYFGFSDCPWCRSVVPTLLEVAKDYDIHPIYYVDIKEIRDTIILDENNKLVTEVEGTEAYYELIELLQEVLSNYTLKDSKGNQIETGEKRISAPNIVKVENGIAVSMTSGISAKQTNGYMTLTDDMLQETYEKFENLFQGNKK